MASSLSAARFCGQSAATFAGATSSPAVVAQKADGVNLRVSNGSKEVLRRGNVWGQRIRNASHQAFPSGASKLKASRISMGWTQMPGGLKTISSGDDNKLWGTDTNNSVWEFNAKTNGWEARPGKRVLVSNGFSGTWALDSDHQLYEWDPAAREFVEVDTMPGSKKITHVASGQDVYVLDTNRQIFKYQGENKWLQIDGVLDLIDTNDYGDLWGIQLGELTKVYRRYQGRWIYIPGPEGRDNVRQISTGLSGVWALTDKGGVYRWVLNTSEVGAWYKEEGSLTAISAGYPTAWGLDKSGKVWKYTV